jgi:hypothetical protein
MKRLILPRLQTAAKSTVGAALEKKFAPPDEPTVQPIEVKTHIQTYFTKPDGKTYLLYTAQSWVKARLMLENAGPVSFGHSQDITPVLSGKGALLPTLEWVEIPLTVGTRIYIAAEAINRVKFTISPVPLAEQMGAWFGAILKGIGALIRSK